MKEELLHYVWKTKSFPFMNLVSTEGFKLQIDHFGYYNLNSGPDFLEGGISILGTKWRGHIEIHVQSSEWIKHNHQVDAAYDNVILHVVWEEDEIIYRKDGSRIPCLELKELIPYSLLISYNRFSERKESISCSYELLNDDTSLFFLQLNRMTIERLEEKCHPISIELENNNQDWSQLLFTMIAKSLGLKVNAMAMESLSRSIPIKLISKHSDQLFQLEALLYGQAGMLSKSWENVYPNALRKEFNFMKKKYGLNPNSGKEWKLMRMRPNSFPTIRISQLASFYYKNPNLHSMIINAESIEEIIELFEVSASAYWDSHFLFDRSSSDRKEKKIGRSTIEAIIINGIVPFLFSYGQSRSDDKMLEKAIYFLEALPCEKNVIMRHWKAYDIFPENAFQSQALIQLKKNYCDKKRCLECSFGNKVLKSISNKVKEESFQYYKGVS